MDGNISNFKELLEVLKTLNTDEEIEEYVKKRLAILENKSEVKTISKNNNGKLIGSITEGYINSKSPIYSSFLVDPFYVNDTSIYVKFLKHIKGKELPSLINMFFEFRDFTAELFGLKGNQQNRVKVYLENEDKTISIADFYKNNSALCSERSAAIQNIAEFCGIDSYLIIGYLDRGEEKAGEHAYNIFKTKDGKLILFDVTNPVAINFDDYIGYIPAFSIIGSEDINNVEIVDFDFKVIEQLYEKPINENEHPRKYITCNYKLNHQNEEGRKL